MHTKKTFVCGLLAVTLFVPAALAEDWPGWLGKNRDGVLRESGLITEIPESGLTVKWRVPVAAGYAGPAVSHAHVFVFDYQTKTGTLKNDPGLRVQMSGSERLTALDARTGDQLWQHSYPCAYEISYPSGPRCTPTIDGNHVYILGAQGDLKCLDVDDGSVVWHRHLPNEFGVEVPVWGFSSHPLIDGELLYTMVGGDGQGIVAFDKSTGEVRWKALDAKTGYCAPQIIDAGGTRQLIVFHPGAVVGMNPSDGAVYWEIPMKPSYEMSVAVPTFADGRLYVSAIHTEAAMISLSQDKPEANELWRGEAKNAVHCNNSPAVMADGVVYGTDCLDGKLYAVDASTGERLWDTFAATKPDEKRFIKHGTAFLTRIGTTNRYLVMSETGDLIVAELTRKGYTEHGRFHVVDPTNESFGRPVVWSHPAYAHRTAYIRNDKEIVAVDLATSGE